MFNVFATTKLSSNKDEDLTSKYEQMHSKMDQILHENRQMKRELSAIREYSEERSPNNTDSPPKFQKLQHISESPEINAT